MMEECLTHIQRLCCKMCCTKHFGELWELCGVEKYFTLLKRNVCSKEIRFQEITHTTLSALVLDSCFLFSFFQNFVLV